MRTLYFNNTFVSLSLDKDLRLGIAEWRGNVNGAEFREAVLICLDMVDRYGLTRWLADDRKMKDITPADALWSHEVFVPRLIASPIIRLARLPSHYPENREAVEVMKKMKDGVTSRLIIRDFEQEEEAMEWLLQTESEV